MLVSFKGRTSDFHSDDASSSPVTRSTNKRNKSEESLPPPPHVPDPAGRRLSRTRRRGRRGCSHAASLAGGTVPDHASVVPAASDQARPCFLGLDRAGAVRTDRRRPIRPDTGNHHSSMYVGPARVRPSMVPTQNDRDQESETGAGSRPPFRDYLTGVVI